MSAVLRVDENVGRTENNSNRLNIIKLGKRTNYDINLNLFLLALQQLLMLMTGGRDIQ